MERQARDSHAVCVSAAGMLEGLSHHLAAALRTAAIPDAGAGRVLLGATLAYARWLRRRPAPSRARCRSASVPNLEWSRPLCAARAWSTLPYEADSSTAGDAPAGAVDRAAGRAGPGLRGAQTREFVARGTGRRGAVAARVGHGYSVERNWLPQSSTRFTDRLRRPPAQDALPVNVRTCRWWSCRRGTRRATAWHSCCPATAAWAGLDQKWRPAECARCSRRRLGLAALLLDGPHAEATARDLARVIEHYTRTWNKPRVLLIGYSQGADVLPFLVNRLPEEIHRRSRRPR